MSQFEKLDKKLQAEITSLRQELAALKRENTDLELFVKTSTEHGDYVEDDLLNEIESTLRENESQIRLISETIPIPIFVTRFSDNAIVYANKPAESFLGLSLGQLLGRPMTEFYDPGIRQALADIFAARKPISNYELQGKRADGKEFWGTLSLQPLTFNNKPCVFSALLDLTEHKETEEKLKKYQEELESLVAERTFKLTKTNANLADMNSKLRKTLKRRSMQDPLTNLYSRHYMEKSLERELSRCKRHDFPLTVIMADIDHFRTFNDTYGPTTGDLVLQRLGQFLKASIRREDIACRYEGEEFALIMSHASLESTRQRAEQMRLEVKEDLRTPYQDDLLGITVSMGIAGFPEHGINLTEILGAADRALYQAKEKGHDRIEVAAKAS